MKGKELIVNFDSGKFKIQDVISSEKLEIYREFVNEIFVEKLLKLSKSITVQFPKDLLLNLNKIITILFYFGFFLLSFRIVAE